MRDAVRVALLARPGAGADRLREALQAAGAELVLDADPTTLEPAAFSAARAESVVVLLDPAVEDALDRLDPVLHDPAIDVLYEEAEVAAAREGWDAARWTRHLSAKLMRHGDVLPPGRESDLAPAPAAASASAASPPPPEAEPPAFEPGMPAYEAEPPVAPATSAPSMFDPVAAEYDLPAGDLALPEPVDATVAPAAPDLAPPQPEARMPQPELVTPEPEPGTPEPEAPEPDWSALTLSLEGDDTPADAPAGTSPTPAAAPDAPAAPGLPEPPAAAPAPGVAPHPGRGDAIRDFRRDLADIEQRIASMGLVADDRPAPAPSAGPEAAPDVAPEPPAETPPEPAGSDDAGLRDAGAPEALGATDAADAADASADPAEGLDAAPAAVATGAVLVFAGIGGPDAVRQFLGALPDAFPRPVLIHQRLDGGRHDRLVQQMARATTLPVHLAAADAVVEPGHVYVLPPGLRVAEGAGGLRFAAGDDPMATLPAAQSAVLMFSGSDTALVDAAMHHARAGALVAGQSPEDCYDAAAADALVARGAQSGQPAELARRLVERWAA